MPAVGAKLRGMAAYAFILALSLAGYLQAAPWLVPVGAAGLTLADWGLRGLPPRARMSWTSKTTTFFVAGAVANLILAALAFTAGRVARTLLG
jgi:hypothetical protein